MCNYVDEIEKLKLRVKQLETEVESLSYSPSYKVLTRGAVERRWLSLDKTNKSMVLFDIDNLHNLNQTYGHETMNQRIRQGLGAVRCAELLGLVYSGDEFVAIADSSEIDAMVSRLRESFYEYGVTFTAVILSVTGDDFSDNYQRAVAEVTCCKQSGQRDSVTKI